MSKRSLKSKCPRIHRVIHGNLLEFGKITKLPLGSVLRDQAIPQVLPLWVENLVVE